MKKYLLLLVIILTGCVYYNTFFNAKKYFREAQEIELKEDGRPDVTAIRKYNKAIKKCGIVLEYYPDSKYADDAVFLLGKSLFYVGRNYSQAITKFEDILKFYPDSEFAPEAEFYLAKANYKYGEKQEALENLQKILADKKYRELHPAVLTTLANYNLENENYIESEYYLKKIIDEYPDSEKFEEAYLLRGKTQFDAENYQNSIEIFSQLLKSRVSKSIKLEARYYIVFDHLLLQNYEKALLAAQKLLDDEYRENRISKIQLILARAQANSGKTEEAIETFNVIIEDNRRTALAAESAFYLGELYFDILDDYENAIDAYNKVKNQYRNSEFVERALTRSSVASQIVQYYNPSNTANTQDLILQHFKLAEYYLNILNVPDSALVIYENIIAREQDLSTQKDSLDQDFSRVNTVLDSITGLFSKVKTKEDTLAFNETYGDTLVNLTQQKRDLNDKIKGLKTVLSDYHKEYLPYSQFVKIWVYRSMKNDSLKASEIFTDLQREFPENKYTYAADKLLKDQEVVVTTAQDIEEELNYNSAIKLISSEPEKTIEMLKPISEREESKLSEISQYILGYLHFYVYEDSLTAAGYLDELLENSENNELKQSINQFYLNSSFSKLERLPKIIELEERDKRIEREKEDKAQEEENIEDIEDSKKEKTEEPPAKLPAKSNIEKK